MRTVGIYTRLSQDRNGDGASTKRQADDCRRLAEAKGWTVSDVYTDRGISGYTGAERAEFERLVADLEDGTIDGAVAWKLDRFGRNRGDHNRLMILAEERGVLLATVVDGIDTSTQAGSLALDVLASMAREESRNISTRVRRVVEERAKAGKPHTAGGRCFGYTEGWNLIDREADAFRAAASRLLAGESLAAVARWLNAQGVTTAGGHEWRGSSLKRTMTSPYVAAIRTHKGNEYPGEWPAILDRAVWEQLRATLNHRGAKHAGGGRRQFLLTGVLYCGCCSTRMNTARTGDGTRRYNCARGLGGCGRVGILAAGVEPFVRDVALQALSGDGMAQAIEQHTRADVADVVAELDAAEVALEQAAADHYAESILSRSEFLAARGALAAKIEGLRGELAGSREASTLIDLVGVHLGEWWDAPSTTNDHRRAVIQAVIDRIEVQPMRRGGSGWDPERIPPEAIIWRV